MHLLSEDNNFSLTLDCPRSRIPEGFFDTDFKEMIEKILGKKYFVSIVFVRESKMKTLNKKYRRIDKSTDILSFPLDKTSGEILLSINNIRRKAKEFEKDVTEYLPFLLIHGMLHLKGLEHGAIMEKYEQKFWNELTNNSRDRHRDISGPSNSSSKRRG